VFCYKVPVKYRLLLLPTKILNMNECLFDLCNACRLSGVDIPIQMLNYDEEQLLI